MSRTVSPTLGTARSSLLRVYVTLRDSLRSSALKAQLPGSQQSVQAWEQQYSRVGSQIHHLAAAGVDYLQQIETQW